MPEQVERDQTLATRAHLAAAAMPLVAESREPAMIDPYREIADRRAQLENAETCAAPERSSRLKDTGR